MRLQFFLSFLLSLSWSFIFYNNKEYEAAGLLMGVAYLSGILLLTSFNNKLTYAKES